MAYTFAMVAGTVALIAAIDSSEDSAVTQVKADSGVQAPNAFLLASRNLQNDKRGL